MLNYQLFKLYIHRTLSEEDNFVYPNVIINKQIYFILFIFIIYLISTLTSNIVFNA